MQISSTTLAQCLNEQPVAVNAHRKECRHISQLPKEMIDLIFQNLGSISTVRFACTNKFYSHSILGLKFWKSLAVELAPERLKLLRSEQPSLADFREIVTAGCHELLTLSEDELLCLTTIIQNNPLEAAFVNSFNIAFNIVRLKFKATDLSHTCLPNIVTMKNSIDFLRNSLNSDSPLKMFLISYSQRPDETYPYCYFKEGVEDWAEMSGREVEKKLNKIFQKTNLMVNC